VAEELITGGKSLDEILKGATARFRKEKVESDPAGRLKAVLRMAKNNQLGGLEPKETKTSIQLVKVK